MWILPELALQKRVKGAEFEHCERIVSFTIIIIIIIIIGRDLRSHHLLLWFEKTCSIT